MNAQLFKKAIESPESLTLNEISDLVQATGDTSLGAWLLAQNHSVITKAATPPTPPVKGISAAAIVDGVEYAIKQSLGPVVARIKTLEAESRTLRDRVLELEATAHAAARVEP